MGTRNVRITHDTIPMTRLFPLLLLLILGASRVAAQSPFTWSAIEIPVRDGERLAADLHSIDTSVAKPVILIQTPYNKLLYRLPAFLREQAAGSLPLDTAAFHYVMLDWRGFYGSRDAASPGYDRGLDGYDAVEWIAAQSWSDGRVATWGPSALGLIQFQTARHHPPHLVCIVPLVKDFKTKYGDYYYGGEFRQSHVETLTRLGFITTDLILAHPTNDVFYQVAEAGTDYPEEIAVPAFMIGGWFDHYPDDILRAFDDLATRSDPSVRAHHRLMIGPWTHSDIGMTDQGEMAYPEAAGVPAAAALAFLRHHLLNEANGWDATPRVRYYQLGAEEWRAAESWSAFVESRTGKSFYLGASGMLSESADGPAADPPDRFTYDPRDPSPTHGGSFFAPFDAEAAVGPHDQRAVVESRGDALIYTSAPFDEPLDIAGPITAELYVSTDRYDTDVAVRLCDVYPDGRSMLLTQGIRRLRFRDGYRPQDTSLVTPGAIVPVRVELQHLALTLMPGHRLRIIVTGSNHPHFAANPNTAAPLYDSPDSLVATTSIHTAPTHLSRLILPVSPASGVEHRSSIAAPALEVHPNPMREGGAIVVRGAAGEAATVELFDVLGRSLFATDIVISSSGEARLSWREGEIASGLYHLRLTTLEGASVRRVMVLRR